MKYLKISNIKLNIEQNEKDALAQAMRIAKISEQDIKSWDIVKYSIDARQKPDLKKIYTIGIKVDNYNQKNKNVVVLNERPTYSFKADGEIKLENRPVIVGFGPAGIFCAYLLAEYGYSPIIIERGSMVDSRKEKIDQFWRDGVLDVNSNVQFGEGGAGAFSDGKLNTNIKDKMNRISFVLETFVKFGAPDNIKYDAKPHIGTDILLSVIKNMRKYIISKGGTFLFDTTVSKIDHISDNLNRIYYNDTYIDTNVCVLALGHSSRETFEMLYTQGIILEPKPFAIGVRVEHKQSVINQNQYGFSDNRIGAANYKLTYKASNNRGVYSFCMCPGGYVVNASSEEKTAVVNGMSYSQRDGENANSAIVVTINPDDFKDSHPLSGMYLQRELEQKAYNEGKGKVPVQCYIDYKNNSVSDKIRAITPNIKGKYNLANLNNIFPEYVNFAIKEGMEYFGKKITGFNADDVILSAVESRTSSPIRIVRDENYEANIKGIYPAGEGAGYAGGITSAAIDGIKIFEAICSKYK